MDDNTKKELQSAAFERLIEHLRERKDVQNLDLMNLAGFCRNCLSKWYREEAEKILSEKQTSFGEEPEEPVNPLLQALAKPVE